MDNRWLADNSHWQAVDFSTADPHLRALKTLPYYYQSPLLHSLPFNTPGIYTVTGGGLVGKTTFLKQWMALLLEKEILPEAISFFAGKLIKNYHQLITLLQNKVNSFNGIQYIFLDDITHINDWDKAIKFCIDNKIVTNIALILSSSLRTLATDILTHSPQENSNFHLYPLNFNQYTALKNKNIARENIDLFAEFNQYLFTGGYLVAINDLAKHGQILNSTLESYASWLLTETLQHRKQETFMREILAAIISHYNKPISWNSVAQEVSINHPKTIADYIKFLENLDVVYVQSALIESTLEAAPKKARKLMFRDPFIFHALRAWLNPDKAYFSSQIKPIINHDDLGSNLVKACVITHYQRYYPTYYIKNEGEIDLAYLYNQRFWPIIVIWANPLRAKDLKQLLNYSNGKILTKAHRSGIIEHVRTEPLPQGLWKLEE